MKIKLDRKKLCNSVKKGYYLWDGFASPIGDIADQIEQDINEIIEIEKPISKKNSSGYCRMKEGKQIRCGNWDLPTGPKPKINVVGQKK